MMVDEAQSQLTSDEAGAFVAQWAEQHKVGLEELAAKLGVDETETASLLRQARGRLHMEEWLRQRQPKRAVPAWMWGLVILALVVGGGLGFVGVRIMGSGNDQGDSEAPLPRPQIQVDTTGNTAAMVDPSLHNHPQVAGPGQFVAMPMTPPAPPTPSAPQKRASDAEGADRPGFLNAPLRMMPPPQPMRGIVDLSKKYAHDLPPDLVVELITPRGPFTMHGRMTRDYRNAISLTVPQIETPVRELVRDAFSALASGGPPQLGVNPSQPMMLVLHVGSAVAMRRFAWSPATPPSKRSGDGPPNSFFTGDAVKLQAEIRAINTSLFTTPEGRALRRPR